MFSVASLEILRPLQTIDCEPQSRVAALSEGSGVSPLEKNLEI